MNSWQLAQQIKHELGRVAWDSGSRDVVFGPRNVLVYAGALGEDQHPPGFPFALVTVGSGSPDSDDPELIEQQFTVITAVQNLGDPMGEFAIIGSGRADYGRSSGAGVVEVGERVRYALERLTTFDGASIIVSGTGVSAPASMGRGKHHAFDEYTVTALCTSRPNYIAPQALTLTSGVWTWTNEPANRFDFMQYRLGFVAGGSPVATPDELDEIVYTGGDPTTTIDTTEPGVYQVFADYNGHGGALVAVSSPPLLGSYLLS